MKKLLFILLSALLISSCVKKEEALSYHKGELVVATDPSVHEVVDALTYRYMQTYPDTHIKLVEVREREALQGLLAKKYTTIVMSRELTAEEKAAYKNNFRLELKPGYFAGDALIFILPKGSQTKPLSVGEIKQMLTDGSKKLIFNGANSGTTDYIAQRLGLDAGEMKYSSLGSDIEIIENLSKYKDHIGVVSLNLISRPFGEEAERLRNLIDIIPITNDQGLTTLPDLENLRTKSYPFIRYLYFLTSEATFGIAKGLMRYSSTQKGQLIVDKNGLQPYYLYPREVRITE